MSTRNRRAWSAIRDDVRVLLRESSAAYWTDEDLLVYANLALDARCMEMAEAHEGWLTQAFTFDAVAGQREYSLPEGTGRVRRVSIRYDEGSGLQEIDLHRNDRIDQDYHEQDNFQVGRYGERPTYRLLDNLLYIEPPLQESVTGGLRIEVDALPPRLVDGDSKLALAYPDVMESLLIFDCHALAMGVEESQGNSDPAVMGRTRMMHQQIERAWRQYIEVRSQSRTFGRAFHLGD